MRVALPKTCIGLCEINARYPLLSAAATESTLHIPLLMPLDVELTSNIATITPAADQQVAVAPGAWAAVEGGLIQAASPRTRELSAAQRTAELTLKLRGENGGNAAINIDRAWIQTCITQQPSAARQDQVVLQFATRRHELTITLPDGAARDQATVQVNGMAVAPRAAGDNALIIPLPNDIEQQRYVLNLQYHFPGPRAGRGAMKFEFPSLGEDAWVRHAYWQLLLPPEEHLVIAPRGMTGEFAWGWNHFYFGRQPLLNQVDLETWAGLSHPGNLPAPTGMNVYLFSSLGRIDSCEIVTSGRSTIVFLSSGVALLAGLLLIYVRAARHPVVLLAATALLAGLAAIYPELALLAGQASAVGLALVLLAAFLRQLITGSVRPRLPELSSAMTPIIPVPRSADLPAPVGAARPPSQATIIPMPPEVAT